MDRHNLIDSAIAVAMVCGPIVIMFWVVYKIATWGDGKEPPIYPHYNRKKVVEDECKPE